MYQGFYQSAENSIIRSIETTDATEIIKLNSFTEELKMPNIDKISFLKLDTEGCEIFILEDILDKLDLIDMMFIEYHSEKNKLKTDKLFTGKFLFFILPPCGLIGERYCIFPKNYWQNTPILRNIN
jgi:hypothetical protein